jgi:hypothetical protein
MVRNVLFALSVLSLIACSDDSSATPCASEVTSEGCFEPTCYEEGAAVSFKSDILPVFEQSCSLSMSCHGNPNSPMGAAGYQPYLGEVDPETTPSDVAKIFEVIVGKKSPAVDLPIVDPGKPDSSFLMHKMDDTLECSAAKCNGDCGTLMPQGNEPLPLATRNKIRDWITQGAKNN